MRTRVRIEHVFPMIACLLIPGFELRVALRSRPRLTVVPAALAPEPGREPLLGPVTAAAEVAGVTADKIRFFAAAYAFMLLCRSR